MTGIHPLAVAGSAAVAGEVLDLAVRDWQVQIAALASKRSGAFRVVLVQPCRQE